MSFCLKDKSVVITGSSRGIGLAIARKFHAEGARLHLIADDAAVRNRAAELDATSAIADISDADAVCGALSRLDRIDILINNAGLERMTPVTLADAEVLATFRRIVEINVVGTALVTRLALPRMLGGGAIVNTASIWGRVAEAEFDAYVASKHAIIGLTKTVPEPGIRSSVGEISQSTVDKGNTTRTILAAAATTNDTASVSLGN